MTTHFDRAQRARLVWSATLVLIAFGGAGFAVAADRPHEPVHRPELTWRSDQAVTPIIEALVAELSTIDAAVSSLSGVGLEVLGRLQSLDVAGTNEALQRGNQQSAAAAEATQRMLAVRAGAQSVIEPWRLGANIRDRLERIDIAASAAQEIGPNWQELADRARLVVDLLDDLQRHDTIVIDATAAGRAASWDEALDLLAQAQAVLGEARAARDQLAVEEVATLDDVLSRYDAYDRALIALYDYVRATSSQVGEEFERLDAAVVQAQAALPPDTGVLSVIVGETAGRPLTDSLLAIDEAHGAIIDALAEDPDGQPTEELPPGELPPDELPAGSLPPDELPTDSLPPDAQPTALP